MVPSPEVISSLPGWTGAQKSYPAPLICSSAGRAGQPLSCGSVALICVLRGGDNLLDVKGAQASLRIMWHFPAAFKW